MGALLERLMAAGLRIETADGQNLRVFGSLTDELRAAIQTSKAAILDELGASPARLSESTRGPSDDRRACEECGNLSGRARCLATWRGERVGNAGREYHPVAEIPRRCEGFAPLPTDSDQRPGYERWPGLARKTRQWAHVRANR